MADIRGASSQMQGDLAHDGAESSGTFLPLKIGGRAQAPTSAPDLVADDDRVDALFDRNGRLAVWSGGVNRNAAISHSTSGNNVVINQVSGKRLAIWNYSFVVHGTVLVRFDNGLSGTALTGRMPFQAREGISSTGGGMTPLFVVSAGLSFVMNLSAGISVSGHVSYTEID
jgi:hypothetical protein